jgi:tight adherence protein C
MPAQRGGLVVDAAHHQAVAMSSAIAEPRVVLAVAAAAAVVLVAARWPRMQARRPPGAPQGEAGERHLRRRAHAATPWRRLSRDSPTASTLPIVALAVAVGLVVLGPPAAAFVGALMAAAGPLRRRTQATTHRRLIDAALPDAVETLVLVIQAGLTPSQAMAAASDLVPEPLRPAFAAIDHRLQRGQRLSDALAALPDHLGPGAAPLADAISGADRYGLPLAPLLDGLADDARADRRRLSDTYARTLSVRLSFPLVICTLPAFVLLAIVPTLLGTLSSLRGSGP